MQKDLKAQLSVSISLMALRVGSLIVKNKKLIANGSFIRILNISLQLSQDLAVTTHMMKFIMWKPIEPTINFGLISIRTKTIEIGREGSSSLIQAVIDLCQLLLALLIGFTTTINSAKRKSRIRNLPMALALLIPNFSMREQKKPKEISNRILVTTILWYSGKGRAKMPRRIIGCDVYRQARAEVFIIDNWDRNISNQSKLSPFHLLNDLLLVDCHFTPLPLYLTPLPFYFTPLSF